ALARVLVRPPSQEFCAVPEASTREVVVLHLADQLVLERMPFGRALGRPATRASRCVTSKTRRALERQQNFLEVFSLVPRKAGAEPDVIQFSLIVKEAEQ